MQLLNILFLIVLGGCATKYAVPTNRFMTPETQGGAFNGQIELQNTKVHQLTIITNNSSVEDGVTYQTVQKPGYMLSMSIFDAFDFVWSHVASGNSMGGVKLQLLGASRTGKAVGHKLSVQALFGGNEHKTADKSIKFRLDGQELMLIYGYRITENILPYVSVGQSSYEFEGVLNSPWRSLNGKRPSYETSVMGVNVGGEFSFASLFGKVEYSYQKMETNYTPEDKTATTFGISAGFQW